MSFSIKEVILSEMIIFLADAITSIWFETKTAFFDIRSAGL